MEICGEALQSRGLGATPGSPPLPLSPTAPSLGPSGRRRPVGAAPERGVRPWLAVSLPGERGSPPLSGDLSEKSGAAAPQVGAGPHWQDLAEYGKVWGTRWRPPPARPARPEFRKPNFGARGRLFACIGGGRSDGRPIGLSIPGESPGSAARTPLFPHPGPVHARRRPPAPSPYPPGPGPLSRRLISRLGHQ